MLSLRREPANLMDKHAGAVLKYAAVVGHVKNIASRFSQFLMRDTSKLSTDKFPNIAQAHRGVAYAVTETYKRRRCDIAKMRRRVHQWDPRLCFHVATIIQLYYTKLKNSRLVGAKCLFLFNREN